MKKLMALFIATLLALSCAAMDADSPVYLALDGVVYEACPTDGGFCLYAPGAQEIAVYVMADGELARCEV